MCARVCVRLRVRSTMALAFRNMHEVLGPYLATASPPTAVSAPSGTQTRLPVPPGGTVPGGLRPIPATTQSNKKTNVQIPYVRRATEAQDVGGVWGPTLGEGSIAFLERRELVPAQQATTKALELASGNGTNRLVDVYSIEQINAMIKAPVKQPYTYNTFPYRLDGVVNNVDGADSAHEFKDYTLVNMAVQGHCRLDHSEKYRADEKVARTSATIYVGLFATRTGSVGAINDFSDWTHKLERFSSNMITRGKIDLGNDDVARGSLRVLLFAWKVGRVVDPAQSENMLTVHVDVQPMQALMEVDAEPYQPGGRYVLRWKQVLNEDGTGYETEPDVYGDDIGNRTVREQLLNLWHDGEQQAADAAAKTAAAEEEAFLDELRETIFSAKRGGMSAADVSDRRPPA